MLAASEDFGGNCDGEVHRTTLQKLINNKLDDICIEYLTYKLLGNSVTAGCADA